MSLVAASAAIASVRSATEESADTLTPQLYAIRVSAWRLGACRLLSPTAAAPLTTAMDDCDGQRKAEQANDQNAQQNNPICHVSFLVKRRLP